MELMTMQELQSKLYLENLCETLSKKKGMLTKRGAEQRARLEEWYRESCKVENMDLFPEFIKNEEARQSLIRENLKRYSKERRKTLSDLKRIDFVRFALLSYCCQVYSECSKLSNLVDESKDMLIADLELLDISKVDPKGLHDFCSQYIVSGDLLGDSNNNILKLANISQKGMLEIDSHVYEDSKKMLSNRRMYLLLFWYNKLVGRQSDICYVRKSSSIVLKKGQYKSIVINLKASLSNYDEGQIIELLKMALENLESRGNIVICGDKKIVSNDFREFRRYVTEAGLLRYFIEAGKGYAVVLTKGYPSEKIHFFTGSFESIIGDVLNDYVAVDSEMLRKVNYDFMALGGAVDYSLLTSGSKSVGYSDMFETLSFPKHNDVYGKVFLKDNVSTDFDSFSCNIDELKFDTVDDNWTRVDSPVIVFSGFNPLEITYLPACKKTPVFVHKSMHLVGVNNDCVLPEFIYLLYQKGLIESLGIGLFEDPFTGEMDMAHGIDSTIVIPDSKEVQHQQYEDAYLIWKTLSNKEKALERMLHFQEWQSESHIHNIKHRLNDILTPLAIDLDGLKFAFERNGTLKGSDIYRKRSGTTVSELIDSLIQTTNRVIETVKDLTKVDKVDARLLAPCNLNDQVSSYVSQTPWKSKCKIETDLSQEVLNVSLAEKSMVELFDYIVENACRHGFMDSTRTDYMVRFSTRRKDDLSCILEVANNGSPMSKNAIDKYFIRGGYVGQTGHSGIGGARVMDIVKSLGGQVELDCNDSEEFPVIVRMTFPILSNL